MASLPPYASVFQGSFPRLPLLRLDDEDRLSVFHAKYWGVNIDQDESKWIGAHGQLMDVDGSEVVRGCFALGLDNDYFIRPQPPSVPAALCRYHRATRRR